MTKIDHINPHAVPNVKRNKVPNRMVRTDKEIKFTLGAIQENPITCKDLARAANRFLLRSEKFYNFLRERGLIEAV